MEMKEHSTRPLVLFLLHDTSNNAGSNSNDFLFIGDLLAYMYLFNNTEKDKTQMKSETESESLTHSSFLS